MILRLLGSFPVWVHIRCFIGTVTCLQACRSWRVHGRAEFLPVPLLVLPCTFLKCDIIWYVYMCVYIYTYITIFELLDSTRPIQKVSLKPKMVSLQTLSIQVCAEWILPKPLKLLKKTAAPIEPLNCERLSVHIPALPRPGIESHILRWEHDILLGCILRSWSIMQAFKGYSLLGHSVWFFYIHQTFADRKFMRRQPWDWGVTSQHSNDPLPASVGWSDRDAASGVAGAAILECGHRAIVINSGWTLIVT